MRRNKRDMQRMENEVRLYLLSNKLDPHAAYDEMVKDYLTTGQSIPYYIKGIKDFIKVSQVLAVELNRKEQMKKADREQAEQKEIIINYMLNLSKEDIKGIYKKYKDKVSHSDKLVIIDMYNLIWSDYKPDKKDINQHEINVFSRIYNDSLQPV